MRLLAFTHRGRRSIGAELDAERVLDFSLAGGLPSGMRAFLELGDDGMAAAQAAAGEAGERRHSAKA